MVFSSPQLSDPERLQHVGQGLANLTPSPPSGEEIDHRASRQRLDPGKSTWGVLRWDLVLHLSAFVWSNTGTGIYTIMFKTALPDYLFLVNLMKLRLQVTSTHSQQTSTPTPLDVVHCQGKVGQAMQACSSDPSKCPHSVFSSVFMFLASQNCTFPPSKAGQGVWSR